MEKPTVGAEGMFALFDSYPDLLPVAAVNQENFKQKTAERAEMRLPCVHCGAESRTAFLASHNKAGYRWIDLCHECHVWVREALQRMRDRLA